MVFGELTKKETKIAKKLKSKLKKLHYRDIVIKKHIVNGTFDVSAIEPFGKRVIRKTVTIEQMKQDIL